MPAIAPAERPLEEEVFADELVVGLGVADVPVVLFGFVVCVSPVA